MLLVSDLRDPDQEDLGSLASQTRKWTETHRLQSSSGILLKVRVSKGRKVYFHRKGEVGLSKVA
jgi:hypothetical protein